MTGCLLNIDTINDFLSKLEGQRTAQLVQRTNDLVGAVRAAGLPVIWVRQEFQADLGDAFLEMRDKKVRIAIEGTWGAQIDQRLETGGLTTLRL